MRIDTSEMAHAGPSEIDIDMDLDLGLGDEEMQLDVANDTPEMANDRLVALQSTNPTSAAASKEAEELELAKIHIKGLDEFSEADIMAYCTAHEGQKPRRIEWIDDHSANLVYDDTSTASHTFRNLVLPLPDTSLDYPSTQLWLAKPAPSRADIRLSIRTALRTDRKQPRAHETSRFYLLHPEHDPREIRRQGTRRHSRGGFRRRRYSRDENERRRKNDHLDGFDASMYDDAAASDDAAAQSSPIRRVNGAADRYRPSRNRSASPTGDGHRRSAFDRRRSPPPGRALTSHKVHIAKELLPHKLKSRGGDDEDLKSTKMLSTNKARELFPNKTSLSNHRRTDAVDAADETADLFAGKFNVPFVDGSSEGKSLAERVTPAPRKGDPDFGRLSEDPSIGANDMRREDLRILGASKTGITIKGAAKPELFPGKGNAGKELFADKVEGRGRTRMRAEDLFGQ